MAAKRADAYMGHMNATLSLLVLALFARVRILFLVSFLIWTRTNLTASSSDSVMFIILETTYRRGNRLDAGHIDTAGV